MIVVWFFCGAFYLEVAIYANDGNGVFAPSNPLIFQNPVYAPCVPNSYAANIEKNKLDFKILLTNNKLLADDEEYSADNSSSEPVKGAGNWYLCESLREEYTGFSPFLYSLDLILPLVDLQQENDWSPMIPTPENKWSYEWSSLCNLKYWTRFLMWFEILFGWVASLLLVAVLSGLTKRQDE
jgi:hypothetical protein